MFSLAAKTGLLLAQAGFGGYSIGHIAIMVVVALAIIGIVIIAARVFGIPIPQWVWQILGIVVVACVAIVAIRFVMTL